MELLEVEKIAQHGTYFLATYEDARFGLTTVPCRVNGTLSAVGTFQSPMQVDQALWIHLAGEEVIPLGRLLKLEPIT